MSRLFSPPVLKGPLTRNELLKNVFPELSAQILGAESFATHETFGTIYTGVKSGHILELKKNQSNMVGKVIFSLTTILLLLLPSAKYPKIYTSSVRRRAAQLFGFIFGCC